MWTSTNSTDSLRRKGPARGGSSRRHGAPRRGCARPAAPTGRGRAGFTLLEVLVALTILSVLLISLHQAYSSNIYITAFNRSLWRAIIYSHNELQRIERLPPPPVSINEGDFEEDDPMFGFHWKREVVDEMPIPGIRLRKVKLEISWTEGVSNRSYRTDTYVVPK